jgi:hypothetical protein
MRDRMGLEHFVKDGNHPGEPENGTLARADTEVIDSLDTAKEAILETADIIGRLPTTGEYDQLRREVGYSTNSSSFREGAGYTFATIRQMVQNEHPEVPEPKNSNNSLTGGNPQQVEEEIHDQVDDYARSQDRSRFLDARKIASEIGCVQYKVTFVMNSKDEFTQWRSSNDYIFENPYLNTEN